MITYFKEKCFTVRVFFFHTNRSLIMTSVFSQLFNIYIYIYIYIYIGCLNIHDPLVTANNSTTNNAVSFFVSDLETVYYNNYQSLISMPSPGEEKIICITTYLDMKSFQTVSKQTQPVNMILIYY